MTEKPEPRRGILFLVDDCTFDQGKWADDAKTADATHGICRKRRPHNGPRPKRRPGVPSWWSEDHGTMTKRRGALMRGSELVEYSRKADAKRSKSS